MGTGLHRGKAAPDFFGPRDFVLRRERCSRARGAQKHEGGGTRSSGQVRASPSRLRASRGAAPASYCTRSRIMPSTRLWQPVNVPEYKEVTLLLKTVGFYCML